MTSPDGDFSSIASGRVINEKKSMSTAEGLYGDQKEGGPVAFR